MVAAAAPGVVAWQALLIVAGGLIVGVGALSILAKMPGGKWLFDRLVVDPVRSAVKSIVTAEVHTAVETSVDNHVTKKLEPIENKLDQVNYAVNNVGPGAPPLKDRVGKLEKGQEQMHGQLSIAIEMLKELVGRNG